jgi:methylated-DNA-[protein]-cysteine S-methyltransferase
MSYASAVIDSPIGPLLLEASERGLRHLVFLPETRLSASEGTLLEAGPRDAEAIIEETRRQLRAYFEGGLRDFDLPLDQHATPFKLSVWQTIAAIPYGSTLSYAEVAAAAGAPNAYRAAGSACATNPIAIVVPCHRVVGSDRGLGGYGGGLPMKAWLLHHEGAFGYFKVPIHQQPVLV